MKTLSIWPRIGEPSSYLISPKRKKSRQTNKILVLEFQSILRIIEVLEVIELVDIILESKVSGCQWSHLKPKICNSDTVTIDFGNRWAENSDFWWEIWRESFAMGSTFFIMYKPITQINFSYYTVKICHDKKCILLLKYPCQAFTKSVTERNNHLGGHIQHDSRQLGKHWSTEIRTTHGV